MKLLNHIYENHTILKEFISNERINKFENILIQIFTPIYEKKDLEKLLDFLKDELPSAKIIGTTANSQISTIGLHEKETILSFSLFENTILKTFVQKGLNDSFKSGQEIIKQTNSIDNKNIKAAICLSNEKEINGDELLNGINSVNPSLIIAGGIAGDYVEYYESYVFTENIISDNATILVTFDNPNLNIITDHSFNWDAIGTKHKVTKSIKNRVYEIDNISALQFYKKYLGENIGDDIIQTCFGIPLIVEKNNINIGRGLTRLNEDESITYSGNISEGDTVRFGYGNTNLILEKSKQNVLTLEDKAVEGIYIYSCIGRKESFMHNSINIEIEQYNKIAPMTGFLTHGEFFHQSLESCKTRFLNQTMTILALSESNETSSKFIEKDFFSISKERKRELALNNLLSKTSYELNDLTQNLEKKVNEEILKNEEKDRFINITQAQAEVGSMLEMIAHQWRQPLSAISSTASAIQIKNELDTLDKNELITLLDEILDLSNFASQTIEDFRTLFKKKQKSEFIRIDDLIKKLNTILKSLISHNHIDIEENYICSREEKLFIPLGQSLQVLINIVKNAVDAIVENNIQNPKITFTFEKEDIYYSLRIEDNGGGIPEKYLPKIFKTRFSTKGGSHGTGIGLDICKSIIEKNLKGIINASNGKYGAIFEIKVPIYKTEEN